eukprot:CAMPEP_0206509536 /NCGR_PEP_ID=MMETSP0324_2-20121206/58987_1 /ASSEMBLY_ACC=CAM_ASM_000836 /TAXON_ID=2866 /ORGANISM="Crypthecodinium cohnii, Strain Seligo" /LENGTH=88 /DNA_ID=CAMNT_0054000611 /DNA_START=219 /DNA_END=481 /DNA_ORIENTATION=-
MLSGVRQVHIPNLPEGSPSFLSSSGDASYVSEFFFSLFGVSGRAVGDPNSLRRGFFLRAPSASSSPSSSLPRSRSSVSATVAAVAAAA